MWWLSLESLTDDCDADDCVFHLETDEAEKDCRIERHSSEWSTEVHCRLSPPPSPLVLFPDGLSFPAPKNSPSCCFRAAFVVLFLEKRGALGARQLFGCGLAPSLTCFVSVQLIIRDDHSSMTRLTCQRGFAQSPSLDAHTLAPIIRNASCYLYARLLTQMSSSAPFYNFVMTEFDSIDLSTQKRYEKESFITYELCISLILHLLKNFFWKFRVFIWLRPTTNNKLITAWNQLTTRRCSPFGSSSTGYRRVFVSRREEKKSDLPFQSRCPSIGTY